jgi:hypothetical protein
VWLVLCNAKDESAMWAYQGLKARNLHPLEIVRAESLVYSASIEHRIQSNSIATQIKLADGRVINSASVRGSLNRLYQLPSEHLHAADASDRQYAEQELYALFLSWLYALPGKMLNRPAPQGLCGAWLHQSKLTRFASQAGLSTEIYRQGSAVSENAKFPPSNNFGQTSIVLGENCFGAFAPENVREGCVRLARMCGVEMLGVDFQVNTQGEWILARATPLPDLRMGGEALLDALFQTLTK